MKVRSDPVGESFGQTLTVNMNIDGQAASSLSVNGGIAKITGTGFPSTWPNKHYNRLAFSTGTLNLPLKIVSMNPT